MELHQGIRWDNYRDNGKWTLVASRNMLNNRAFKHLDNEGCPADPRLPLQEIENNYEWNANSSNAGWEATLGAGYEYVKYNNGTSEQRYNPAEGTLDSVAFASDLKAHKYGVFGTVNRKVLDERLALSAGFRADGSTLGEGLRNPLQQFSPRFSASYAFAPGWTLNANTGRYFQMPAYTILGYVEDGERINAGADARYLSNTQAVAGIRWEGKHNIVASLKAFGRAIKTHPVACGKAYRSQRGRFWRGRQ